MVNFRKKIYTIILHFAFLFLILAFCKAKCADFPRYCESLKPKIIWEDQLSVYRYKPYIPILTEWVGQQTLFSESIPGVTFG